MTIAAVPSGAESLNDIDEYVKAKQEWLKSFLLVAGGNRTRG